jgi:hypothetical protein
MRNVCVRLGRHAPRQKERSLRQRLVFPIMLVIVAGLLLPAAALGLSPRPRPAALRPASPAGAQSAALSATVGAATGISIGGAVLAYDGTAVANAEVDWGYYDAGGTYVYGGYFWPTKADGLFNFAVVTAHPGNDDLWATYADANGYWNQIETWANTFHNNGTYNLRPGHVPVVINAGGPAWDYAQVTVGAWDTGWATTWLAPGAGVADVPDPGFNTAFVAFADWWGQTRSAVEWSSPGGTLVPVSPGTSAADTITLDQSAAKWAYLSGPRCRHSGKPGTVVKLELRNWPVGQQVGFYGYSQMPWNWGYIYYNPMITSADSGATYYQKLTVPTRATVGKIYEIHTYRTSTSSLLDMGDYFQVCTLNASPTSVRRGTAIKLSGTVPTHNKYVDIFKRTSAAIQPATLSPSRGWVKVGRYPVGSTGRFTTGNLHPLRSTWYVARYPGNDTYFSAYTSVRKVTVH